MKAVAETFNELLKVNAKIPKEWEMTRLIVLFKKGDPRLPDNYRLIAILPILYK